MKKLFAVLMSIMMIACFMPTMAFADGETSTSGTVVAKIGETSYETLETAINAAKNSNGGTIELQSDVRLNDLMPITGNVTINGNNKTITGVAGNNQVGFVVASGSFTINNATLTGFGKDAATATGVAVVKVPYDAAADTAVNLTNVKINNFCRSALDIRSGSFTVDGCEIDCKNVTPNSLTKGILAGLATNKVTGTVKNTTITNSASTAEGWTSGAVEVKFNADVTVENCEINQCATAFLVTAKWRGEQSTDPTDTKEAKLTVKGGEYSAESRVLRADARDANKATYNTTDTAVINVLGGTFTATGQEGLVFKKNGTPELTSISVSGGKFSQNPSEYTASGATMTKNADGTFTVTRRSSGGGGGSSVTPTTPSQDVKTDTKTGTTTVATDVKVSEKTNADGTKEKVAEVKVSAAKQKEILKQAKAGKSKDIVLSVSKSEVRDAGKADVTLDKSFIESIANDTDAKLTIQTPFGEKTYTKEELKKLAAEATGSTITMTIEPAADDSAAKIEKAKEIVADMQLVARSSKTAKKSVKVVLKTDDATKASIEELKALGFKVEYKFYRSTKKAASYKAGATKGDASYTNTVGKKGTKYFYKVRVVVSNGDGVVVQTALKQCKYASRTWTK